MLNKIKLKILVAEPDKRRIIYKLFLQKAPIYDVPLPKSKTSLLYELKVYLGKIKLNVLYFFKITLGFRK